MSEASTVTLLYTANLEGRLALLPRLATLIQAQRRQAAGPVFLLDLGDTCALDAWVCPATEGRAPLTIMDGMGYDAVFISGPEKVTIPPAALRRLAEDIMMAVIIWGRAARLSRRGVTISASSGQPDPAPEDPVVTVDRDAPCLPDVGADRLVLGDVPHGSLACVVMDWPAWTVQDARLLPLEPHTPPDPTIGAIVELVENEARYYAERRNEGDT